MKRMMFVPKVKKNARHRIGNRDYIYAPTLSRCIFFAQNDETKAFRDGKLFK
jgi:hypothetical protein